MKTNLKTAYSKSPVITVTIPTDAKYVAPTYLFAIDTATGTIYRQVDLKEELVKGEEVDVNLSAETIALIEEFIRTHGYSSASDLLKKMQISKWLQTGCGFTSYSVQSDPLQSINISRYYDVMELKNKAEKIARLEKENRNLMDFGTNNPKAIAKIVAEREKQAKKAKKIADKARQEAVLAEAKNLIEKRKAGYLFIAIVRKWSGSHKHMNFLGESKEFRFEKPKTNNYHSIENCKNLKSAKEVAARLL